MKVNDTAVLDGRVQYIIIVLRLAGCAQIPEICPVTYLSMIFPVIASYF